jgi:hypothetical protein
MFYPGLFCFGVNETFTVGRINFKHFLEKATFCAFT